MLISPRLTKPLRQGLNHGVLFGVLLLNSSPRKNPLCRQRLEAGRAGGSGPLPSCQGRLLRGERFHGLSFLLPMSPSSREQLPKCYRLPLPKSCAWPWRSLECHSSSFLSLISAAQAQKGLHKARQPCLLLTSFHSHLAGLGFSPGLPSFHSSDQQSQFTQDSGSWKAGLSVLRLGRS